MLGKELWQNRQHARWQLMPTNIGSINVWYHWHQCYQGCCCKYSVLFHAFTDLWTNILIPSQFKTGLQPIILTHLRTFSMTKSHNSSPKYMEKSTLTLGLQMRCTSWKNDHLLPKHQTSTTLRLFWPIHCFLHPCKTSWPFQDFWFPNPVRTLEFKNNSLNLSQLVRILLNLPLPCFHISG